MEIKTRHRRSLRLPNYDYSRTNAFFLTICAAHKKMLFGQIKDGSLKLSECGQAVEEEWFKTQNLRAYVTLDEFIVMPNHFHGILWLDRDEQSTARRAPTAERFGQPVPGSLPTIIRAFKAAVSRRVNTMGKSGKSEVWQRGYYEHVIRDDASLNRIREYIVNNPLTWVSDRENPVHIAEHEFYRWLAGFKTRPGLK